MNVPREKISLALFQLLQSNEALQQFCKTITRVPRIWTEPALTELPCLTLFKGGPGTEEYSQAQASGLTKYLIHYNLWLYLRADPTNQVIAETTINNIADAIDICIPAGSTGLSRTPLMGGAAGQRQTLGGLVNNTWLDGGSEWGREFEDENIVVAWRITVDTGM